jgi:hypothetical protein
MEKEIPLVFWLHLVHLHRRKVALFRNGFEISLLDRIAASDTLNEGNTMHRTKISNAIR